MDNKGNNKKNGKGGGPKKNMVGIVSIIVWAIVIVVVINQIASAAAMSGQVEIKFSELIQLVKDDEVEDVKLESNKYTVTLKEDAQKTWMQEYYGDEYNDSLQMPKLYAAPLTYTDFLLLLDEHGVSYSTPYQNSNMFTEFLVGYLLPMLVIMGIMMLAFRFLMGGKMGGGMGIGNVGKSNAKMYVEKSTGVTFRDVAGQDEAKESLEEIIDFLHNPGKYTAIGAKLPKGALLVGSPGTGKTLLAKAVAGEANVPFFSISGSDFVEMFVGVGASRVRDLFKEAAKVAPCIIFIDEIDTIGKSRDGGRFGGNDEREQTLNQLLAELDGFDPSKGVIVLGATNRPEVLDKALLRPGRFDRRITVDRPNLAGRLATLQVHTRNIRLAEDVNLDKIAQATAGCVGADLANLVNEAALRAVRKGRKAVNQNDLLAAFETVIAGSEKKGTVITQEEKRIIAYHEVGHALVAAKQKNAQPVSKITIVPHTQGALGYTLHAAGRTVQRGDRVQHHDLRRGQRHRARHGTGPQSGGPVRYVRRVRHDGPGHRAEPVSGRRVLHDLRPGDVCRGGPGHHCHHPPVSSGRQEAPGGKPGAAGQNRGVSAEEGDHYRPGDDGHHRGTGPGDRGQLRRHPGGGPEAVPSLHPGRDRSPGQAHQYRVPAYPHAGF